MHNERTPNEEDGQRGGLESFITMIEQTAATVPAGRKGTRTFVRRLGEECAHIRPGDIAHPLRFLRQMAGQPPLRFGTEGFNPAMVDDQNSARHYVAFVVVGYWLPMLMGRLVLCGWEVAGFVRYRGHWSPNDMRSGMAGLRHGRSVQREGPWALPPLVRRDLGMPTE